MRSRTATNNQAKLTNKILAKMQYPPPKSFSADDQNLPAGPALAIAPKQNALAKTRAPIPQAGQKNPAQAKLAAIFLASQQKRTATKLQLGCKIIGQMQKDAPRNRAKHAPNRQMPEKPNQDWPNRVHLDLVHHGRNRGGMAD